MKSQKLMIKVIRFKKIHDTHITHTNHPHEHNLVVLSKFNFKYLK